MATTGARLANAPSGCGDFTSIRITGRRARYPAQACDDALLRVLTTPQTVNKIRQHRATDPLIGGSPRIGSCANAEPRARPGWWNADTASLNLAAPRGRTGSSPVPGTTSRMRLSGRQGVTVACRTRSSGVSYSQAFEAGLVVQPLRERAPAPGRSAAPSRPCATGSGGDLAVRFVRVARTIPPGVLTGRRLPQRSSPSTSLILLPSHYSCGKATQGGHGGVR